MIFSLIPILIPIIQYIYNIYIYIIHREDICIIIIIQVNYGNIFPLIPLGWSADYRLSCLATAELGIGPPWPRTWMRCGLGRKIVGCWESLQPCQLWETMPTKTRPVFNSASFVLRLRTCVNRLPARCRPLLVWSLCSPGMLMYGLIRFRLMYFDAFWILVQAKQLQNCSTLQARQDGRTSECCKEKLLRGNDWSEAAEGACCDLLHLDSCYIIASCVCQELLKFFPH